MNEIISNGVRSIVDLARNKIYEKVFTGIDSDTYLNMMTGDNKTVIKGVSPISHVLLDLNSLIRIIADYNTEIHEGNFATFVSPSEVVTIIDYSRYRANTIKVPLTQSPILNFLKHGYEGAPRDAIRTLKYNLKSAISGLEILSALQSLKFEVNKTAQHDNAQNDEAVSQSLKAKVTGAATIPDEFEVAFDIYPSMVSEFDSQITVKMELHVDPSAGTVSFRPFPGAIDAVIIEGAELVRSEIAKRLRSENMNSTAELVFLGKP